MLANNFSPIIWALYSKVKMSNSTIKNYDVAIVRLIRFISLILASQLVTYIVFFIFIFIIDGLVLLPADITNGIYSGRAPFIAQSIYWSLTLLSLFLIIKFVFNRSISKSLTMHKWLKIKSLTMQKWLKTKSWFSSLNNDYDS